MRNFRNPLPADAPERFKEMAIQVRRVEILRQGAGTKP